MPTETEELFDSIQITAKKIGYLEGIDEAFTEIKLEKYHDGRRIVMHGAIKDVVEKFDDHEALFFRQVDNSNFWALNVDAQKTEQYYLIGTLASAFNSLLQPFLKKIQDSLQKTIDDIQKNKNLIITVTPSYLSTEQMFCIDMSLNNGSPFRLCHRDIDELITVAKAGIPNIIRRVSARKTS